MPEPFQLTFGVELEFVCIFPKGAFNNQEPDLLPTSEELDGQISAGHALQYYLTAANIPATGWEELGSVAPGAKPYSQWHIHEDCVITTSEEVRLIPDGYIEEPIEISSRILHYGDDWRGEIRTVLDVLAYMQLRYGARFITNESTGFHVHVGNAGGKPMPFDTVKRLFQVATAHERVIDSIHASSRVLAPGLLDHDSDIANPMLYAPLSFYHKRQNDKPGLKAYHVFDWLQRIESMHAFEDFCMLFGGEYEEMALSGHRSTVNFDNLFSDTGEDLTNTVESRQHVGTIDYAEIVAWVTFLSTFVSFCHNASDADIMELTLRATDTDFTAADLMRAIRCSNDIIQHYQFDDEDSVIGMLPQGTNLTIALQQDPLASLTDQNDDEVTENTDRLRVKRLINQKLSGQYYGFDSALGLLPISRSLLVGMLQRAYEMVSRNAFIVCDLMIRGGESRARALVWIILSLMHQNYDPTMGPFQPAIAEGVSRLAL